MRVVAIVLLVGALASGCAASKRTDDRRKYLDAADALCRQRSNDLAGVATPTNAGDFKEYVDVAADFDHKVIDQLRNVKLPKSEAEKDKIEDVTSLARDRAEVLGRLSVAIAASDPDQIDAMITELTETSTSLMQEARSYGFRVCFRDERAAKLLDQERSTLTLDQADSSSDDTVADDGEPVDTEPFDTEPVETEPVETEPFDTAPSDTTPPDTEPFDTAPSDTEPSDSAPVDGTGVPEEIVEDSRPIDTAP